MDDTSQWNKVRQLVAERVLARHLQDLDHQQLAAELDRRRQVRQVERQLQAMQQQKRWSNRMGSLSVTPKSWSEPLATATRRHSMPTTPGLTAARTARRSALNQPQDLANTPVGRYSSTPSPPIPSPDVDANEQNTDSDEISSFLDMMASTLRQANAVETRRPSLYLQSPRSPSDSFSHSQSGTSSHATGAEHSPPPKRHVLNSLIATQGHEPTLAKKETFGNADTCHTSAEGTETLTATADARSEEYRVPRRDGSKRINAALVPHKAKKQQKQRGKENGGEMVVGAEARGENLFLPRRGSVTVNFYNEQGPKFESNRDITQSLETLTEENEEVKYTEEDESEEEDPLKEEDGEEETTVAEWEGNDPWGEVKKCQYIRGYDPPQMRMPKDMIQFVFGDDTNI